MVLCILALVPTSAKVQSAIRAREDKSVVYNYMLALLVYREHASKACQFPMSEGQGNQTMLSSYPIHDMVS
jgi:hypothetical protein